MDAYPALYVVSGILHCLNSDEAALRCCESQIAHYKLINRSQVHKHGVLYTQVEELRNPSLKGSPLGVTQKYLIVTSNYAARSRGVSKLMGIKDAQAVCPEIHLVRSNKLPLHVSPIHPG